MTGLRQRMTVFAIGAVLAVLATAVAFGYLRATVVSSRHVEEETRLVQRLWESLVDQSVTATKAAAGSGTLTAALEHGDGNALAKSLSALDLTSIALVNGAGQLLLATPNGNAAGLLEERRLGQVLTQNYVFDAVALTGGRAQLMLAQPFGTQRPADRVLIVTRALTAALEALAEVHGGSVFLTDGGDLLYGHVGPLAWSDVRPAVGGEKATTTIGGRSYEVGALRVPGVVGDGRLLLVTAREITLVAMADSLLDTTGLIALLIVLFAGTVGLDWYFRRTFTPVYASMSALSALAGGDTSVAVLGAERADEAGQLARTVEVFRSRSRTLQDSESQRARHWLRQQAFIRKQMLRLSETLPDQGRQELLADLARIEAASSRRVGNERADDPGALAVAFEVMAERVRDQHTALDSMVRQLQAALNTKTELLALQKQFEIARHMQEAILPADLVDHSELGASGLMLQAAEFDGSFYDFFQAEDGALVLLLGQVSGGGLAAGFTMVTARATLRTLASTGMGPAACLTAANRLLAADNAAGLSIGLSMGVVSPRSRRLVFANAGLPEPFIARRLGDVVDLPTAINPPLGLDPALKVSETNFDLPVPSTLVFCNSGVLFGANRFGVALGRPRVIETLAALDDLSAGGVVTALSAALAEHAGGASAGHDRICLAVRVQA